MTSYCPKKSSVCPILGLPIPIIVVCLQAYTKRSEISIGQTVITPGRYELVEYLPWMYTFEFIVQSKRPEAIGVSYRALILPFDKYIWYFIGTSMLAVFLVLITIQKCWVHASRKSPPTGWVFQGDINTYAFSTNVINQ